jgi:hypothetical protein
MPESLKTHVEQTAVAEGVDRKLTPFSGRAP